MRSVVRRMQKQEQMIQVLVDDLRMRNHEGVLYLRGERMYCTQELVNSLRVSRKTLMRYRNAGNLPYIILRNSAYYKESDVEKLITRYGSLSNHCSGSSRTWALFISHALITVHVCALSYKFIVNRSRRNNNSPW